MSTYTAFNVELKKDVPFKWLDRMGTELIIDEKTGRQRGRTIRDAAEDAMQSVYGTRVVHGWTSRPLLGAVCRWMSWKDWKALLAVDSVAAHQAIQNVLKYVGTTGIRIEEMIEEVSA